MELAHRLPQPGLSAAEHPGGFVEHALPGMRPTLSHAACVRPAVPGEVWHIDDFESHCLAAALERLRPFLDENEHELAVWELSLRGATQVTPFESDRILFELLVGSETAHLWQFGEGERLPCGHGTDEHIACLRAWAWREVILPKHYAASRRLLATLSPQERLYGRRRYARADARALVEDEITRLRRELESTEDSTLAGVDPTLRGSFDRQLGSTRESLLREAREHLEASLEPLIID
jgi:hypothetical protein